MTGKSIFKVFPIISTTSSFLKPFTASGLMPMIFWGVEGGEMTCFKAGQKKTTNDCN